MDSINSPQAEQNGLREMVEVIRLAIVVGKRNKYFNVKIAQQILSLLDTPIGIAYLKSQGWVRLDTDQSLPEIPEFTYDKLDERKLLKRGAINYSKLLAGFRRIQKEYLK